MRCIFAAIVARQNLNFFWATGITLFCQVRASHDFAFFTRQNRRTPVAQKTFGTSLLATGDFAFLLHAKFTGRLLRCKITGHNRRFCVCCTAKSRDAKFGTSFLGDRRFCDMLRGKNHGAKSRHANFGTYFGATGIRDFVTITVHA